MKILALNTGSSSLKFGVYANDDGDWKARQTGLFESTTDVSTLVSDVATRIGSERVDAIVHRVVHGGDRYSEPTWIDDAVLDVLRSLSPLAPLHNPPALSVIQAARSRFDSRIPHVACFDTAFHRTIPPHAATYAVPRRFGFRRFGFHGIAHQSVVERYAELTGNPHPTLITLHLGHGCSACAVERGRSVDTSMGLTPMEGLIMGTRGGDLDPGIPLSLARSGHDADRILNHESGLQALAGTDDMRQILREHDEVTLETFCYRARKYAGAYLAALGGAEAIVFSGGIGENAPEVRARICAGFDWAGLTLDPQRTHGRISADGSRLHAWVIPAEENLWTAKAAARLLEGVKSR